MIFLVMDAQVSSRADNRDNTANQQTQSPLTSQSCNLKERQLRFHRIKSYWEIKPRPTSHSIKHHVNNVSSHQNATSCWKVLSPNTHWDVTLLCTTQLNTVTVQADTAADSSPFPQQYNPSHYTTKTTKEYNQELKALACPSNFPDVSFIKPLQPL